MDVKSQIMLAVKMYDNNEYKTEDFCEIFIDLYYFESSGHSCFNGDEKKALDKLASIAERYSTDETDIAIAPAHYKTESQFRHAFDELKRVLLPNKTRGS